MNTDIQQALDAIKANLDDRQRFINYYDGAHPLAFATVKFHSAFGATLKGMRDNLCPIVVDAVADRMEIINFAGDESAKAVADQAWQIWQRELMELESNKTHVEALKTGAAYLIVWNNDDKAKFYLQDSRNCCVIEDKETSEPLFGAKMWETEEHFVRLILYYPDRTERYITQKKREAGQEIKAASFIPHSAEGVNASDPNPYNTLPIFEFECSPVLSDAIPIQDALNKTFADRLVTQEFGSFRQRYATGLEPPTDELTGAQKILFDGGIDKLWFTNDEKVKFGDFEVSPLEPFLKAADSDRIEMARVTGTPLHFFSINTSDAISGKALKTLESRFTKKVKRLCINFGSKWGQAMKLALHIERTNVDNVAVQWEPAEQRDEVEVLEALGMKRDTLDVPVEVLQEEYGYSKEDVEKFKKAAEDEPVVDPAVKLAQQMTNGR